MQDDNMVEKLRGRLTTNTHTAVDTLNKPARLLSTSGQASEYGQTEALLDTFTPDQVLANKGYDSDTFVEIIQCVAAKAVIPSRKNRQQAGY